MMTIDYDQIADFYDIYADTAYDVELFKEQITGKRKVIELTSGTGRLSIPLIEAGANLTCVDQSAKMLEKLTKKLQQRELHADVVCMNLLDICYDSVFDLAILPFQSFMEIVGQENQLEVLLRTYRSLIRGGTFICTMHNPAVRKRSVDGVLRYVGHFRTESGVLAVSGVETGGNPVVERFQYFEMYDGAGVMQSKSLLRMEFEFIGKDQFRKMAESVGFKVLELWGSYDKGSFVEENSPVLIWKLEK